MKKIFAALLGIVLACASPAAAFAQTIPTKTNWYVQCNDFTRDGMVDNFSQSQYEFAEDVGQLQPGDDITFTIELRQKNESSADWYISSDVVDSLEDKDKDGNAIGSAYGYTLAYEGPSNSHTIYSSDKVGGSSQTTEGLKDVDKAMDQTYYYLGTLSKGEKGTVTLKVELDGETEGNEYFNTLANLKLKFAVEPTVTPQAETTPTSTSTVITKGEDKVIEKVTTQNKTQTEDVVKEEIITEPDRVENIQVIGGQQVVVRTVPGDRAGLAKTGDPTTMFPVYLGIAGLGIVCLALAIRNVRKKDNEGKGGAR